MNGRVLPFDASAHAAVDARLPFYVNKTLRGEELALVEQHILGCEQCQREVEWLRELFAACAAIPLEQYSATDVVRSTAAIDRAAGARSWHTRTSEAWRATQPWVRGLLAAQLAAIMLLGTWVATGSRNDPTYQTLGASRPATGAAEEIAIVFDPAVTEAEMRQILVRVGARIVNGPTPTHAFVLEVSAARSDEAVHALRAERKVQLAERMGPSLPR